MTYIDSESKRVLTIDPSEMGFGFAVLEGPRNLIDWGLKVTIGKGTKSTQKNNDSIKRIEELIERYEPDAIVTEDYLGEGGHRCNRMRRLIERIKVLASLERIPNPTYSKAKLRKTFLAFDIHNKSQRSVQLAEWFPELASHVPKYRKAWMAEDNRMSIFDAVALAVVYYSSQEKVETSQPSDVALQT
jgi:Holliday junction resolvasome RuvABC endonuclease subunit